MIRRTALLALPLLLAAGVAFAQAPMRVRGTIQAIDDGVMTVETRDGAATKMALAPNVTVTSVFPTTMDAIKPGAMIGVVGFGPPAHQKAAVISIFPPAATVGESQFAWDSAPNSTMTNAPIKSEVSGAEGRVLTVTVKGEPVEIEVPPNAIIQTSGPGDKAMLVPGAHVLVTAQPVNGALTAIRVNVGKDGFVPAN